MDNKLQSRLFIFCKLSIFIFVCGLLISGCDFIQVNMSCMGTNVTCNNSGNVNSASSSSPPAEVRVRADAMIIAYQVSSGITDDLNPIDNRTSFNIGDKIYVTFRTAGKDGYILARWYLDGKHAFDNDILNDHDGYTYGYVAGYFNVRGSVIIELYWCTLSNCKDASLARKVKNVSVV